MITNIFILLINVILPLVKVLIEKGHIYTKCESPNLAGVRSASGVLNIEALRQSCTKVNWTFLEWSIAQWHLLFASILLIIYPWSVFYVQKQAASSNHTR